MIRDSKSPNLLDYSGPDPETSSNGDLGARIDLVECTTISCSLFSRTILQVLNYVNENHEDGMNEVVGTLSWKYGLRC